MGDTPSVSATTDMTGPVIRGRPSTSEMRYRNCEPDTKSPWTRKQLPTKSRRRTASAARSRRSRRVIRRSTSRPPTPSKRSSCECVDPPAGERSAAKWASRTRRCGARSSSTRSSGRTCMTTRSSTPNAVRPRCRVARMFSPKIEPEIVFKLKRSLDPAALEPAAVLDAVEWLALGFEIIDCVFPDWKFQPADFVASYGLHAALVVGEPLRVEPATIASLADALPRFTVQLRKNGELVEEGSGKNSLRSPALCLGELGGGDRPPVRGGSAGGRRTDQLRHVDDLTPHRVRRTVERDRRRSGSRAAHAGRSGVTSLG